jgi:hypothetical protein
MTRDVAPSLKFEKPGNQIGKFSVDEEISM